MDVAHLTGGGSPVLGEALPIEFGNTVYAKRGRPNDGLQTVEHLAAWLRDMRHRLTITLTDAHLQSIGDDDLRQARELRDTIRTLAAASVEGSAFDADAVAALNRHAARAPRWRELRAAPEPHLVTATSGRPVEAALAALAEEAATLFAGSAGLEVCACHGPGCVLFFVRDSPRREWCSAGCGNRARVARHYARTKAQST